MANTSVTVNIETNLDEVIEKTEKLVGLLEKLKEYDGILLNAGNITVNGSVTIHDGGDRGEDMKSLYRMPESDNAVATNKTEQEINALGVKVALLKTQFETWNRHELTDIHGKSIFAK